MEKKIQELEIEIAKNDRDFDETNERIKEIVALSKTPFESWGIHCYGHDEKVARERLFNKNSQLMDKKSQLISYSIDLISLRSQLRDQKKAEDEKTDYIAFDKSDKRKALLRALQMNGVAQPLFGREKQIAILRKDVFSSYAGKQKVGILCATRGMGKTTFLKAMIDPEGYSVKFGIPALDNARAVGRLAVADLGLYSAKEDPIWLWKEIIVNHLYTMFKGSQIDGVDFRSIDAVKLLMVNIMTPREAIELWCKLTKSAFAFADDKDCKPIILLDEIGNWVRLTESLSNDNGKRHTMLSNSIQRLQNSCYVICAGTADGNLQSLSNYSNFLTVDIPLSALSMEDIYKLGCISVRGPHIQWPENLDSFVDSPALLALFYQTLQVPRLVDMVFDSLNVIPNIESVVLDFEHNLNIFYRDVGKVKIDDSDLAHILFACACGWQMSSDDCVPNTNLKVRTLVGLAMIFPYSDGRYVTSLTLFNPKQIPRVLDKAKELCGVDLAKCYISYNGWLNRSLNIYEIGVEFESIFATSLCIKYYLHAITQGSAGPFKFTDVYDLKPASQSYLAASKWEIDLHKGYNAIDYEVTDKQMIKPYLYHNISTHSDAADIIAYKSDAPHLHIQCKYLITANHPAIQILSQLKKCTNLLWVQLGVAEDTSLSNHQDAVIRKAVLENVVAFVDGSGCCNPMLIDLLYLLKQVVNRRGSH